MEELQFIYTNNSDIKYSGNENNTEAFQLNKMHTTETYSIELPDVSFNDLVFNIKDKVIYTHGVLFGELQDMSSFVTKEEFDPIEKSYTTHIAKGSLGKINGLSIEDGNDISFDMSLYKIVTELPTENILDSKIYIVPTIVNDKTVFTEYVYVNDSWDVLGIYKDEIDLSGYLTKDAAEKTYMKLTNGSASISIGNSGSMSNYGNNGLAFNAVRDCGTNSITGKNINAGAFGVKLDGTTAFTHKTYDTFNAAQGTYTGAKNTAVLTFSGQTGLRYAKNTGSGNDVTQEMYKYVGVIDSPDPNQKVYSASQVDALIKSLQDLIDELKQ